MKTAASTIIALVFLASGNGRAQVANDNSFSKMLLDRVIADIFPKAGTDALPSGLQINTVPQTFGSDPRFETFQISKLVDYISPAGDIYKNTANRFTSQYGIFIKELGIPPSDQSLAPALKIARTAYEAEVKQYAKVLDDQQAAWKKFHSAQTAQTTDANDIYSKQTWLTNLHGGDAAVAQEQALSTAAQNWISLANQASAQYRQIAQSIVNYDNLGNRRNVQVADGDERQLILYYDHIPRIKDFLEQSKTVTGPGHAWDYSRSQGWKTSEASSVGGSAGYFGFGVSAGTHRESFRSDEDEFGFNLEFGNWGKLSITPGDWFDSSIIKEFAYGPFSPASGIKNDKKAIDKKLWSPDTGSMPWIVSELVLVYKPKISITMSHKHYESFKASFVGSAGLSIGPFSFGASAGGSKEDIHWDDSHNRLTVNGPESAQVLAVIHSYLPLFK